jgi:Gpi18-like mannosyltransferase
MIVCLYILAICLRWTLFGIHTWDYDKYFSVWYDFIHYYGGFAALKYNFANYNVSYFYLLAIGTYIPLPKIVIIKFIPVCFDALVALFVYLIIRLKYEDSYLPTLASLVVLFTPTVFLTSALWGQFESIYGSLSLASLYFLLRKQPIWALVLFGLAVSFKPQALLLFPLFLVLCVAGQIRKRYFLMIPMVYLITILPACLIGRGFIDVLTTYRSRTDNPGHALNLNAPNIFQWLPIGPYSSWESAGIILAMSGAGILSFVVLASRRRITDEIILKLALVFVLVVPFLLPEMHERYFYLADIISIVYAFYFPKYFYVTILIQISSLISYSPYLNGYAVINLKYVAFLVLVAITVTILDLVKTLYEDKDASSGMIQDPPQDASSIYDASEATTVRQ